MTGDGESCVNRPGTLRPDQRGTRIEGGPALDCAVKSGKQEQRSPTANLEFRRSVVDDASRRTLTGSVGSWHNHLQSLRIAFSVVECRPSGSFIADPEGLTGAIGKTPGILEEWISVWSLAAEIGNQVGGVITLRQGRSESEDQQKPEGRQNVRARPHAISPLVMDCDLGMEHDDQSR